MVGMRAFRKIDVVKKHLYWTPSDLYSALFLFGTVGGGKSATMMSLAQKYHDDKKYKIFDFFGGERKENYYWSLPTDEDKYASKVKKIWKLTTKLPKEYRVHYIFPMWGSKLPKRLPQDSPRVRSSVFTIPIKKVELDDIRKAIGE